MLVLLENSSIQNNNETRTEILSYLFETNGIINELCIVDIFGNFSNKPTFNFKGKEFKDCKFDNYEYFWECDMDDLTVFKNCFFRNINPRKNVNIKIHENLFHPSCDISNIQHLINNTSETSENNLNNLRSDLIKIFKLFYKRGNFYPRKQEEVRKKLSTISLLQNLLEKEVIVNYKDPKKPTMRQYIINNKFKNVIEYIEQGTPSLEFNRLINELS